MNQLRTKVQVYAFVKSMGLDGILVTEAHDEWVYDEMQFGFVIKDLKCYAEVCVSYGALDKPIMLSGVAHQNGFATTTVVNTPGRGGDPGDCETTTLHESLSLAPVLAKAFDFIISNRIDNASEVTFGRDEEESFSHLPGLVAVFPPIL